MAPALLLAPALASSLAPGVAGAEPDRHWNAGGGRHCPPRLVLPMRILGYVLLLASPALALWRDGPGFDARLGHDA